MIAALSQDQISELKEAFDIFDKQADQIIDDDELTKVFKSFGHTPTKEQIQSLMTLIGDKREDGKLRIDFQDFAYYMISRMSDEQQIKLNLKSSFIMIDKDDDGMISRQDIQKCCDETGDEITQEQIEDIFDLGDKDRDGKLSWEEYVKLMIE